MAQASTLTKTHFLESEESKVAAMKKVMIYELATGRYLVRDANDDVQLSAGELDAEWVTCDITSWSDTRLAQFTAQDKESQIFDLEALEFTEFSRQHGAF